MTMPSHALAVGIQALRVVVTVGAFMGLTVISGLVIGWIDSIFWNENQDLDKKSSI